MMIMFLMLLIAARAVPGYGISVVPLTAVTLPRQRCLEADEIFLAAGYRPFRSGMNHNLAIAKSKPKRSLLLS